MLEDQGGRNVQAFHHQSAGLLRFGHRHRHLSGHRRGFPHSRRRDLQEPANEHSQRLRLALPAVGRHIPDHRAAALHGALRSAEARTRQLDARFPLRILDRHAVRRRHGHRTDVLRRRRTDDALHGAANGRAALHRRHARSDERHLLSLGHPRLGDLRRGRIVAGLLRLPLQSAAHHPIGPLPAPEGAHQRADRPCRRHLRHRRHRLRHCHLAWPWRFADQCRPQLSPRRRGRARGSAAADRHYHRPSDGVRRQRARPGCAHPVRDQSRPRHPPDAVRSGGRPHQPDLPRFRSEPRPLPRHSGPAHLQHLRLRTDAVDRRLDAVLLGMVDFLVAVRRHVHRPHLARPYRAGVHHRRAVHPCRFHLLLDDGVRQHGHLHRHAASPPAISAAPSPPTFRSVCSASSSICRSPA